MKKIYTLTSILLVSLSFGQTPISLIGVNVPYTESFDGMGSTETSYLPGWTAINSVNGTTLAMQLSDGNTSAGNVYNIGTTTSSSEDRAFGSLADAMVIPAFGAVFQNNTGSVVSKVSIQTRMEQWKQSGNASVNETVAFYYSTDATSLSTGNWTAVSTLNLNEKLTAANTNLAVNGNLASNYTNITTIISGLNWADGTNMWIKWVDTNDAGANGMYAIENFIISVNQVLGLKKNAIEGLNMYPNPVAKGTLYITSNSSEAKSVTIYDVLGKQVLNAKTANGAVNVSNLKAGSYIAKITEDGKTDTKKLIIQ
ncbi:T9SS type A sorting domain-containing protein [Flavobacterium nackdongense]|uniref:T9SS type A sorting domain-containing protein n=1 Tax=Flavobacterium nackdongense TaxID=2547394 RepID=A0A4P6YFM4_9FLAO|nr:T9SS type A sorting domain-containing protein [Flavobacterium nackdongense]QBN19575.1 T9SS type A sorting domain-containing protein [Flavobacterium nackdongense]